MTLEELRERQDGVFDSMWSVLTLAADAITYAEQLQRERDEAVDILRTTMNVSKRMTELLARIEGGQDE